MYVAIGGNVFFELTEQATETRVMHFDTSGAGNELAIPVSYSLTVHASATEGSVDGNFAQTGHLFITATNATAGTNVVFRTETAHDYSPPGPELNIQIVGNDILISWPASTDGFQLETTPSLAAGNQWTTAGTPALVGQEMIVTNSVSSSDRFYWLRR